jgi:hypothetical protein
MDHSRVRRRLLRGLTHTECFPAPTRSSAEPPFSCCGWSQALLVVLTRYWIACWHVGPLAVTGMSAVRAGARSPNSGIQSSFLPRKRRSRQTPSMPDPQTAPLICNERFSVISNSGVMASPAPLANGNLSMNVDLRSSESAEMLRKTLIVVIAHHFIFNRKISSLLTGATPPSRYQFESVYLKAVLQLDQYPSSS